MVPGGAPIELTVLCRPFPPPPFSLAPEDQASKHEPRVLLTRLTARVAARVVLLLVWGQLSSHPFFLSAPSGLSQFSQDTWREPLGSHGVNCSGSNSLLLGSLAPLDPNPGAGSSGAGSCVFLSCCFAKRKTRKKET